MGKEIEALQSEYVEFLNERDWNQHHTPQNVAQAISVEAGELLELFLWHDNLESDRIAEADELMEEVEMELADILIYCMSMAHQLDIDLTDVVDTKLQRNRNRFDEETSKKIRDDNERWQR